MNGGKQSGAVNGSPAVGVEPSAPGNVRDLIARLLAVGAAEVMYVRDGLTITTPASEWSLGPAQWLVVRLPLGDLLPDGAVWRAQKNPKLGVE